MRGSGTEAARLLDATGTWEAYADGIASVEINGPNARITYFAFRTVCGERVMVPVAEIVLPATVCGSGLVTKLTLQARTLGRAAVDEDLLEALH